MRECRLLQYLRSQAFGISDRVVRMKLLRTVNRIIVRVVEEQAAGKPQLRQSLVEQENHII